MCDLLGFVYIRRSNDMPSNRLLRQAASLLRQSFQWRQTRYGEGGRSVVIDIDEFTRFHVREALIIRRSQDCREGSKRKESRGSNLQNHLIRSTVRHICVCGKFANFVHSRTRSCRICCSLPRPVNPQPRPASGHWVQPC